MEFRSEKDSSEMETMDCQGFDVPSEKTDVVFIVGGHKLHLNKGILSFASPVFDRMFYGDFKEKSEKEICLPDKKCEDFITFLLCIYPNSMEEVRPDTAEVILPLAVEYQVQQLINKCEKVLLKTGLDDLWIPVDGGRRSGKQLVHSIVLAEKYNLSTMFKEALKLAGDRRFSDLQNEEEFTALSEKTRKEIMLKRINVLENSGLQIGRVIMKLLKALPVNQNCGHANFMYSSGFGGIYTKQNYCYDEKCKQSLKSSNITEQVVNVAEQRQLFQTFFHTLGLEKQNP